MLKDLPNQKLVPISEAAEYLKVSIDTVRRWDKAGVLHSSRPDGKNRHFSLTELERVKFSRPLMISQVAQKLGMSMSTLRRLEKKGIIDSSRDKNGERVYTHDSLEKFLQSDYYLRQRSMKEKIPEPVNVEETSNKVERLPADLAQDKPNLQPEKKTVYLPGLVLAGTFILLMAISFLVSPEITAPVVSSWARAASDVAAATWDYPSRSLLAFGSLASAVWGLPLIVIVSITGFVFLARYYRTLAKKDELIGGLDEVSSTRTASGVEPRVNLGSVIILILSVVLGLVGGLATVRIVQKADILHPQVQAQDRPSATTIPVRTVYISVPVNAYVNIRREPTTKSEVVAMIKETAEVTKLGQENGWVRITTSLGEEGWVSEEFTN